jgi:hypothetical protein
MMETEPERVRSICLGMSRGQGGAVDEAGKSVPANNAGKALLSVNITHFGLLFFIAFEEIHLPETCRPWASVIRTDMYAFLSRLERLLSPLP